MTGGEDPWGGLVFDGTGRLVDLGGEFAVETFGPPPPMRWVPVTDVPQVYGQRVCVVKAGEPLYDLRAVTEVYSSGGGTYLNLVEEWRWYYWLELPEDQRPEVVPRAISWPTRHVWVQVPDNRAT